MLITLDAPISRALPVSSASNEEHLPLWSNDRNPLLLAVDRSTDDLRVQ
jgi:hypothetical protein